MNLIFGILLFIGYAFISCIGLYLLKSAADWCSIKFLVGAILYIVGAGIWLFILRLYPLSIAFPIASGAIMIGTTATGYMLLKENITLFHFLGISLTFVGISILATQVK